jgi:chromosome partitioning protein
MSLLDKLSETLFSRSERARNKPLLDAAMAVSALVATADGEVSFANHHTVDEVLSNVDALRVFDVHLAVELFKGFAEDIHSDPEDGRTRAMQAVQVLAGESENAKLLVRVACAVARADGRYSGPAIARIHEIAGGLGQQPPDLQTEEVPAVNGETARPRCIAVGNQKGGTGKSTAAIHLAVGLLKHGHRVGCVDLDGGQSTLSHFMANRAARIKRDNEVMPMPQHRCIEASRAGDRGAAEREEQARLDETFAALSDCDFIVLDTPGSQNHLARLGHASADILITPLNDSFLDIDVLARVERSKRRVLGPSIYAEMVAEESERRVAGGRAPIDWIVMRNRLAQLDANNSRDVQRLLRMLGTRMGFRLEPGFSERVIFRELFYQGMTLLDLPETPDEARFNPSRWNARREIGELLRALRLTPATVH